MSNISIIIPAWQEAKRIGSSLEKLRKYLAGMKLTGVEVIVVVADSPDKTMKKKILAIMTICMFAGMMLLNISTTITDSNFSVNGLTSLAYGSTGGGPVYENSELTSKKCWVTGEDILYCNGGNPSAMRPIKGLAVDLVDKGYT